MFFNRKKSSKVFCFIFQFTRRSVSVENDGIKICTQFEILSHLYLTKTDQRTFALNYQEINFH